MTDNTQNDLNVLMAQIERLNIQNASKFGHDRQDNQTVFAVVTVILSDLIGGLFVGGAIGYICYKYLNMHLLIFGILILLGGFAGFINMYKSLVQFAEKNKHA